MKKREDLLKIIQNKFNRLSKGQKLIAEFITDNYDKAAFMTAASLGKTVGVSESTIVRFAITLGYEGYRELQKELQELIKMKLTTIQRISLSDEFTDYENILKLVFKKDMENIEKTLNEIDHDAFKNSIKMTLNAENVYILGLRSSSFLAGYLGFYLNFLLDNVKIIKSGPSDIFEQLLKVNKNDIVIGISYPRYSKRTLEALDYVSDKGCNIIGITDSLISPAAQYANISLIASGNMLSFVDSLVAPMSLINAFIIALSNEKKVDTLAYFEELENIWKKYSIYDSNNNYK